MARSEQPVFDPVVEGLAASRHFVGEMHPATFLASKERCLLRSALTDEIKSPAGVASVGTLATLIDLATSDPALATCAPDWTATQDLAVYGAAPITEGPIVVDARLVRVGKKAVVVSADIYDGHGLEDFEELEREIDAGAQHRLSRAGTGLVTFVRIPRPVAPGVDDHDPDQWIRQAHHRASSEKTTGSFYERMNFRNAEHSPEQVELDRTSYVANSIGTISGGAQALLLEVTAERMCPGMAATDMQLHYLSQVKVGPARSSGVVVRDGGDHAVVSMRLIDAGNNDQLLALATVTLQRQAAVPLTNLAATSPGFTR
jgi:acyl-coenzyme A thioesterase PaaI-like protein